MFLLALLFAALLQPRCIVAEVHVDASQLFNVTDRYIVTLRAGVDMPKHAAYIDQLLDETNDGSVDSIRGIIRRYKLGSFRGYTGQFSAVAIAQLRENKDVAAIEPDRIWRCASFSDTPLVDRKVVQNLMSPSEFTHPPDALPDMIRQKPAIWNLHHVSHRGDLEDGVYWYDRTAGRGTYGYVVDSGVQSSHSEFLPRGRVRTGYNAVDPYPFTDPDGHGTHVASTMCGRFFGVAKQCTIVPVKVIHETVGTLSAVLEGYAWAAEDIVFEHRTAISVINMSLGGPVSSALNYAIDEAFKLGVTTVVAAGNEGQDARYGSPASAQGAITVGSTDVTRQRAVSSNFGPSVAVYAPGMRILGASVKGNQAMIYQSGTSMASPHVAGIALYFKGVGKGLDSRETRNLVLKAAVRGVVKDPVKGSNLFVYNASGK